MNRGFFYCILAMSKFFIGVLFRRCTLAEPGKILSFALEIDEDDEGVEGASKVFGR